MLIGLGAKNAVLRVTFAVELREQGLSIMDATIRAGEERFRPIIMTSLAFIFGVLPLAIATGAGANARHSIGTGIMGGMIGEATLAMLYVPLFFYLFDKLAERNKEKKMKKALAEGHPPDTPHGDSLPESHESTGEGGHGHASNTGACTCNLSDRLHGWSGLPPTGGGYAKNFTYEDKEAKAAVDTEWWKQFQDPVLDGLIAEALANNKNVKIAAANIEQAAGVLTQTRSPLFPQVSYGAGAGRQMAQRTYGTAVAQVPSTRRYSTRSLPGPAGRSICGAASGGSPSRPGPTCWPREEARRGVILSLVASVAGNYLQLRGLDEQLGHLQAQSGQLMASQSSSSNCSSSTVRSPQMNVEQARTQYETAAATIPQIESQIVQTGERHLDPAGPQPGTDPARQVDSGTGVSGRSGRVAVAAAGAPARPRCRPSRT